MALIERHEDALATRLDQVLARAIEEKRIVGAVALVAQDGALAARRVVGLADRERRVPMREDTPFRFASLTKPIVSTAALGLIDRGKLALDADIAELLPGFRPTFAGAPARITVRHLLTHTSGLGYAFLEPRDGPYHAANVSDGLDQPGLSLDENLARLSRLPLHFAPGTAFLYSLSTDVLGAVLERASGEDLPRLIARAVTEPLAMHETAFTPRDPEALAVPYADGKPEPTRIDDGSYVPFGEGGVTFAPSRALDPRSYPSGGAGLVGIAADFLRFLEAVRTRHPFAPSRWLDEMLRDQIAPITSPILGDGWGYGFGAAVLRDPKRAASPMHAASVRWGGAYGHSWFIDPEARLSAVLLTNTAFEGMNGALRSEVANAVYGV
jgi:CubicO group peptidase (beta-lactamase class C family)